MEKTNGKTMAIWCFLFVLFFVADRWAKSFFLEHDGFSRELLRFGNRFFVGLRLEKNSGIAFSIDFYFPLLIALTLFAVVFLFFLLRKAVHENKLLGMIGVGLIISGAFSNLYDRIAYGYVVDYIDFSYFSVFNIADIMISTGLIVALFQEFRQRKKKVDFSSSADIIQE